MNQALTRNHLGALASILQDRMATTSPLSDTARALISTLHYWGPMSATRLAAIADLTQPSATRALDRLRQAGLVTWPDSGRTRPAQLTETGRAQAQALIADRDAVLQRALSVLSDDEIEMMAPLLARMLAHITPSPEAARHMCRFCDHAICDGPECPVGQRARTLKGHCHDPD